MFTETSVLVREICNGVMCVSALMVIAMFVHYIVQRCCERPGSFWDSPAVQGATALAVLMTGHAIRAFSGWMQFLFLDHGWNPLYWANASLPFLAATAMIVGGKMLIVYTFAPYHWRYWLIAGAAFLSVVIPVAVALALE